MSIVPAGNVFNLEEFGYDDLITPGTIFYYNNNPIGTSSTWGDVKIANIILPNMTVYTIVSALESKPYIRVSGTGYFGNWDCSNTFRYDDRKVYYQAYQLGTSGVISCVYPVSTWTITSLSGQIAGQMAWLMWYGGYDGYSVTYDLTNCIGDPNNPTTVPLQAVTTPAKFSPNANYSFNSGSCWIEGDGFPSGTPIVYRFNYETGELVFGVVTSDITIHVTAYADPYSEIDGESEIEGGSSIPIPQLPPLTATAGGIIGLFAPSTTQMQLLADYMWTDFGGTGSTEVDVLKEIVQALKRTIANPLDFVIGLNIIPSQGLSIGSNVAIRFGFVNSNVTMPRLTNQYFVVDCGTLSFDTLCGNTFLDYAPYSKFSIYLPYIGFKDVDPNDFVGHTIGVIYHGDVVTGGITAYITKDGSVMYQYSGCCALSVPLNADGWGSTIAGAVQIATSVIVGGATGSSAGVVAGAVNGAANVASNPSLLSPTVMRSGAVSGGAGCMGVQTPFVVREAVRFHPTTKFNTISGYPAFYYRKLSTVHGYTTVYDCHIHGVNATDNEIIEIERLLKEGVIF